MVVEFSANSISLVSEVAALTWLLWDIVITLGDEVRTILTLSILADQRESRPLMN